MSFSPITGHGETTIHTSATGLKHGSFVMPTFDGTINAYYAAPANSANAPVILVVQEIFGLHEHIQDVCRRLAHEGYFAVAVELYQRQGDASQQTDTQTLLKEIVSKVPDEQVMGDLDASVQWAASQGGDISRLGITGFCWGGRLAWMYAAHNPACKAAVVWYGKIATGHGPLQKRNPIDIAASVHGPVLGLYAGQDASIPVEDVHRLQAIQAQGNAAAKASEMVVYPHAKHAFYADYRPSYRADDAKDGWARALGWFKTHLA